MHAQKPKPEQRNTFLEGLKLIAFCPLCERNYRPIAAKVLEEKGDAHLVHIRCQNCDGSVLALVITGHNGISSISLVTDLTSEDIRRFQNNTSLNTDDVIDVHQIVNTPNFSRTLLQDVRKESQNGNRRRRTQQ